MAGGGVGGRRRHVGGRWRLKLEGQARRDDRVLPGPPLEDAALLPARPSGRISQGCRDRLAPVHGLAADQPDHPPRNGGAAILLRHGRRSGQGRPARDTLQSDLPRGLVPVYERCGHGRAVDVARGGRHLAPRCAQGAVRAGPLGV